MKSMTVAYALFSAIFAFSAICPIKFLQSAFVGAMEKNNIAQEYIDGMLNITSVPMLVVIVAAGLVGGLIGAVIGQKALKKHFIKAGLVQSNNKAQPLGSQSDKRRQAGCLISGRGAENGPRFDLDREALEWKNHKSNKSLNSSPFMDRHC